LSVETATVLLALGSATLGESGARPMRARIKPAWPGARLAAPAYPVVCGPGDNLAIHVAVASAPAGAALAVDAHEEELGFWGEVLTTGAQARGLAGLVIDGCVRDIAALEQHEFPVFSAGIALPGAAKVSGGTAGRNATVGGARVDEGDWLVGDSDGVVVVPGSRLDEVIAAGTARQEKESGMFQRLRDGATTLELLGLDRTGVEVAGAGGTG
jgi:4-hydroxy-4-methyl-2-oxoglutarate aldolase